MSCQVTEPDVPLSALTEGEEQGLQIKELEEGGKEGKEGEDGRCEYVIDGGVKGNVARFFNHSCDPNMFMQNMLWDHGDIRFAHPVLVAGENIVAMTVSGCLGCGVESLYPIIMVEDFKRMILRNWLVSCVLIVGLENKKYWKIIG